MQRISRSARRNVFVPEWAGNADGEDPFRIRVKPLSTREAEELSTRFGKLVASEEQPDAEQVAGVLGEAIEGPFNRGGVWIDDVFVAQGDLLGLIAASGACDEAIYLKGNLVKDLWDLLIGAQTLNRAAAGESERARGLAGSTPTPPGPRAASPEAAAAAAPSSPTGSTT